jgi:hypothetical protein
MASSSSTDPVLDSKSTAESHAQTFPPLEPTTSLESDGYPSVDEAHVRSHMINGERPFSQNRVIPILLLMG